MKKLFILSLIACGLHINSYSQEQTINLNHRIGSITDDGMKYLGDGTYSNTELGWSSVWSNSKNLEKKAIKDIEEFAKSNNADFKIISSERQKQPGMNGPKIVVTFKLYDASGNPLLSKQEAKKQILDLKELLELGVINKEEFDEKAASLKSILLGK